MKQNIMTKVKQNYKLSKTKMIVEQELYELDETKLKKILLKVERWFSKKIKRKKGATLSVEEIVDLL